MRDELQASEFDGGAAVPDALREEILDSMVETDWQMPNASVLKSWAAGFGLHQSRIKIYCSTQHLLPTKRKGVRDGTQRTQVMIKIKKITKA